jgi:hypothetical protein
MSSRHTLGFNDWEAVDPTGKINTDYALTTGRVADNRDPNDYGEDSDLGHGVRRQPDWYYNSTKPLKRGNAAEVKRMEHDTWHVSKKTREGWDWTCKDHPLTPVHRQRQWEATRITGIPAYVKAEEWSMVPLRCSVCWETLIKQGINDDDGRLPSLPDKSKFCGAPCRRAADAARKARKRRLADGVRKYPREARGRYVIHEPRPVLIPTGPDGFGSFNIKQTGMVAREVESVQYVSQFTPWPTAGLNVTRPSDQREHLEIPHRIMAGVRQRQMIPPTWWVDTVDAILVEEERRRLGLVA